MTIEKESSVRKVNRWWEYKNIIFLQDSFSEEEVPLIYNCIQPILNKVPAPNGGIILVRTKKEVFFVYICPCPEDNLPIEYYVELPKAYMSERAIRTGQSYEFEGLYTIIKATL